jgi:HSP20 family protein
MGPSDRDELAMLALLREAAAGRAFSPPTDVYATDKKVVISVELPGVAENAVTVDAEALTLTVRGQRAFQGGGLDYYRLERTYGEFRCQVALPRGADPARKKVQLADGVLTVEIPRTI